MLRYRNDAGLNADGLIGEEGTFVICSFWLVSCLALAGEIERAEALFARLAGFANDLGLLAEEIDTATGEQLGQLPAGLQPHRARDGRVADRSRAGAGRAVSAATDVDAWDLPDGSGEVLAVYVDGVELAQGDWAARWCTGDPAHAGPSRPGAPRRDARRGTRLGRSLSALGRR